MATSEVRGCVVIRVVSPLSVKARELIVGDRVVRESLTSWYQDDVIRRVERSGVDNERVLVWGEHWEGGFGVDRVIPIERTVSFTRGELVSLIDEIVRDRYYMAFAAGDRIVQLLEGRRVPA